jgi:hypothetical protein
MFICYFNVCECIFTIEAKVLELKYSSGDKISIISKLSALELQETNKKNNKHESLFIFLIIES